MWLRLAFSPDSTLICFQSLQWLQGIHPCCVAKRARTSRPRWKLVILVTTTISCSECAPSSLVYANIAMTLYPCDKYCEILLIRGGANVRGMPKILLVHGNVISWVTGLLHQNSRQFINCLWGCKNVGKGTARNPGTLTPHKH